MKYVLECYGRPWKASDLDASLGADDADELSFGPVGRAGQPRAAWLHRAHQVDGLADPRVGDNLGRVIDAREGPLLVGAVGGDEVPPVLQNPPRWAALARRDHHLNQG